MSPRTILVIAEGQLGDLLLLTPALRAMATGFPGAEISVLALERRGSPDQLISGPLGRDADHVLASNPNVHHLYRLNRARLTSLRGLARAGAELAVVKFLRSLRCDAVLCTFPEDRFALWAWLSGAAVRIGQKSQALQFLLTHRPEIRKGQEGVRSYYCDLASATGATITSDRTEYEVPEPAMRWAGDFLTGHGIAPGGRLIAVHPGATGDYKIWPPERYAGLIDGLQANGWARVILLQGERDEPVVSVIRGQLAGSVIESDPASPVARTAALLRHCSLCISNDSGPRHLSAAVGTPSLALFRRHHDREWGIYSKTERCEIIQSDQTCPFCPEGECLDNIPDGEKFGSHCLRMITAQEVLGRVHQLLDRGGGNAFDKN